MTDIPRPEYPRPQFVRPDWLCLNGIWEFAFDDAEAGRDAGWHDGRSLPGRITVPFAYQTELSGISDKAVHEVVWYARSFTVPPEWRGQDILLHFGAVDYRSTVWVNGQEVGHNRGGHVPFWFDIAPYLRDGENRLTVRVEDRQDKRQPRGKQASSGVPAGIDYYCTTGIWQSVWLEPAPSIRIDSLRITPHREEETFEVRAFLHAPATGWRLEAEARNSGGAVVASAVEEMAGASARLTLPIPHAWLWSPESPHLYDLTVRLYDKETLLDTVQSYAGMQDVRLRDGRVFS